MKRIVDDLAKSVYQVAERVRYAQVVQRKRLNREASGDIYRSMPSRSSG